MNLSGSQNVLRMGSHKNMTSLKEKLFELIKTNKYVSYGEMCQFTAEEGYKISTSERRLREFMSVDGALIGAERKKSKRNTDYISAYLWLPEKEKIEVAKQIVTQIVLPPAFEKVVSTGKLL